MGEDDAEGSDVRSGPADAGETSITATTDAGDFARLADRGKWALLELEVV